MQKLISWSQNYSFYYWFITNLSHPMTSKFKNKQNFTVHLRHTSIYHQEWFQCTVLYRKIKYISVNVSVYSINSCQVLYKKIICLISPVNGLLHLQPVQWSLQGRVPGYRTQFRLVPTLQIISIWRVHSSNIQVLSPSVHPSVLLIYFVKLDILNVWKFNSSSMSVHTLSNPYIGHDLGNLSYCFFILSLDIASLYLLDKCEPHFLH